MVIGLCEKLVQAYCDVFIVLLATKIRCEREISIKTGTTPNTEISGPPCAFLICFKTSRVNNFKYVLLFLFLFFAFINILLYILLVFFFSF